MTGEEIQSTGSPRVMIVDCYICTFCDKKRDKYNCTWLNLEMGDEVFYLGNEGVMKNMETVSCNFTPINDPKACIEVERHKKEPCCYFNNGLCMCHPTYPENYSLPRHEWECVKHANDRNKKGKRKEKEKKDAGFDEVLDGVKKELKKLKTREKKRKKKVKKKRHEQQHESSEKKKMVQKTLF